MNKEKFNEELHDSVPNTVIFDGCTFVNGDICEQIISSANSAIEFALSADEGLSWLRCWNEGNFEACRREWPETPEECFIGADPLHPKTLRPNFRLY